MTDTEFKMLKPDVLGKLDRCRGILRQLGKVAVAFSGGVDSTFLLALAVRTLDERNVLAVMSVSPSQPKRERKVGRLLAKQIGTELVEIETKEMDDPNYSANPTERCFFCKSELFRQVKLIAENRDIPAVVSGANADDVGDFRPGLRAGDEMGVRSPLLEAGLTKQDIRDASRAFGLPTWDKPSMACLASRVPYGQQITAEKLSRIEQAECVLADLGFSQIRVRDHGAVARIEVPASEIPKAVQLREKIVRSLKSLGYNYVAVDLQGFRSGSMNEAKTPDTAASQNSGGA